MQALRAYRTQHYVYSDDSNESNSPPNKKYGLDFSEYYAELFKSGLGSDIRICVKGKSFALHRNVINARSAVFRTMFETGMVEGQSMTVNIDHYEVDVMTDLFEYIYTCRASTIEITAAELLGAADEYGLDDLKQKCVRRVLDKITNETTGLVFCLAKKYNLPALETKSTKFIIEHIEDIADEIIAEIPVEGKLELIKTLAKRAKTREMQL